MRAQVWVAIVFGLVIQLFILSLLLKIKDVSNPLIFPFLGAMLLCLIIDYLFSLWLLGSWDLDHLYQWLKGFRLLSSKVKLVSVAGRARLQWPMYIKEIPTGIVTVEPVLRENLYGPVLNGPTKKITPTEQFISGR